MLTARVKEGKSVSFGIWKKFFFLYIWLGNIAFYCFSFTKLMISKGYKIAADFYLQKKLVYILYCNIFFSIVQQNK